MYWTLNLNLLNIFFDTNFKVIFVGSICETFYSWEGLIVGESFGYLITDPL